MHDLLAMLNINDDPPCQWEPGQLVNVRLGGTGDPLLAIINAVDLPTRRLRVIMLDGAEHWVYVEWCYREGK